MFHQCAGVGVSLCVEQAVNLSPQVLREQRHPTLYKYLLINQWLYLLHIKNLANIRMVAL